MLQLQTVDDLAAVRLEWQALLDRSASNQPTLSPLWLQTWWRVFGPLQGRALRVALVRDGERVVGLVPLQARRHRYGGWIPFRRLELLGSGEDEADEICSDYLGIVVEPGRERAVAEALATALVNGQLGEWDELVLSRMDGETALPGLLLQALGEQGIAARLDPVGSARYLPLPPTWDALLRSLPSASRYMIKRSLRDFESWAGARAEVRQARTHGLDEGMRVLRELHGVRWQAEGQPSLFDSAPFRTFHEAVMPELLAAGALDLRWLVVDGAPLAALYNIVWDNKVHFYQGGRALELPKGLRPGVVLHLDAIRSAIEEGRREYDFLAGESLMKRQLGPRTRPLVELRAARVTARELTRAALARGRAWVRGLRPADAE